MKWNPHQKEIEHSSKGNGTLIKKEHSSKGNGTLIKRNTYQKGKMKWNPHQKEILHSSKRNGTHSSKGNGTRNKKNGNKRCPLLCLLDPWNTLGIRKSEEFVVFGTSANSETSHRLLLLLLFPSAKTRRHRILYLKELQMQLTYSKLHI